MKLIYIAGPYRGKTTADVQANINAAWSTACELVYKIGHVGYFPVIPHLNTMHMDGLQGDDYFLSGTMELMERCDGILSLPGCENSAGSMAEIKRARDLGIPVFMRITDIIDHAEKWKKGE